MQKSLPPTQQSQLSANDAIGYLIASQGNSKLAAVRASKELNDPSITEATLLSAITSSENPIASLASLTSQLRLLLILNTVEAFRVTHTSYMQALPSLSPKETAHTYTKLLESLTLLATPPPPSTNAQPDLTNTADPASLIALLPQEVQDAITYFSNNPTITQQSNGDNANPARPATANP